MILHQAIDSITRTKYTWEAVTYDAGEGYLGPNSPTNILVLSGFGRGTAPAPAWTITAGGSVAAEVVTAVGGGLVVTEPTPGEAVLTNTRPGPTWLLADASQLQAEGVESGTGIEFTAPGGALHVVNTAPAPTWSVYDQRRGSILSGPGIALVIGDNDITIETSGVVKTSGDDMTGPLNMNANGISGVATASSTSTPITDISPVVFVLHDFDGNDLVNLGPILPSAAVHHYIATIGVRLTIWKDSDKSVCGVIDYVNDYHIVRAITTGNLTYTAIGPTTPDYSRLPVAFAGTVLAVEQDVPGDNTMQVQVTSAISPAHARARVWINFIEDLS